MSRKNEVFPNRLINGKAAASYLGIDVVTLNRWVHEGIIPFVKLGKSNPRYDLRDLDKLIEDGKKTYSPLKVEDLKLK